MGLLWLLVLLLIIFALVGGFAVNNWLLLILVDRPGLAARRLRLERAREPVSPARERNK